MYRILVVDTETTGFETTDEMVEVAAVWIQENTRLGHYHSLIRPHVPVNVEARAVHHITDEELNKAPTLEDSGFSMLLSAADILVAHNVEFDRRMLLQSGVPDAALPSRCVCTWRCALHLYPMAPRHSNQVLRYWLGLNIPKLKYHPHRALPDALVTSELLLHMLKENTIEHLEELSTKPALLHTVKFGKRRGLKWQEMDTGFLAWVLSREFGIDEKHTARYWLKEKRDEAKRQSELRESAGTDGTACVPLAGMRNDSETGDVGLQPALVPPSEKPTE